ncbi:hypothetical protein GCM10027570_16200 [Streptomonospora sediminis]
MAHYLDVPDESGGVVRIEVDAPPGGMVPAGRGSEAEVGRMQGSLNEAMERIRPMAEAITSAIGRLPVRPESYQAEFGVKFSTDLGVVVARTKAEAHVTVTLNWGAAPPKPEPGRSGPL